MGIDCWVIWVADFNSVMRFYVRRRQKDTRRRLLDTRRPPSHQNVMDMTIIPLWVSILGLFGLLISIISLDFTSAAPPPAKGQPPPAVRPKFSREMTDVSLWVSILGLFGSLISILSLDFTSAAGKRTPAAGKRTPAAGKRTPAAHPHIKIQWI